MTKYNSLSEMVEAYKEVYNANCSHEHEHFSTEDVIDVCVSNLLIPNAKAVGIQIAKHTKQIEGFGYVAA